MKRYLSLTALAFVILVGCVLGYALWKRSPDTSDGFFASGKKYYDQQKYPEAVVQFLNALRKDPRHRDARYLLARSYMNQADYGDAAAQLKSLLEYYPDDISANLQLGGIYLSASGDKWDLSRMALDLADKVLPQEPQNVEALILSGNGLAV